MALYNPKSRHAEEFINDAEILELTDISPENLASIREETANAETH